MTEKQQINCLGDDIDNLIERYRQEFNLSYASVVGVLQIKIHLLCDEADESTKEER